MMGWIGVITNSVWLLGLAVCLAALSYADWQAHISHGHLRVVLSRPALQLTLWTGVTLFCSGVALSGGRWWERILWSGLTVIAIVEMWHAGRAMRARVPPIHDDISSPDTPHWTNST